MSEHPLFFENKGMLIFATHHDPAPGATPSKWGIVFCPAYTEEAGTSQKVCVDFARLLAEHGHHVLRFDYRGTGDSEGDFSDSSLATHESDIRCAIETLRRRADVHICLLGLRLGATLAAKVAATANVVEALILLEPLIDLRSYIKNFFRRQVIQDNLVAGRKVTSWRNLFSRLESGQTVDIMAFPISTRSYETFMNFSVPDAVAGYSGPILIIGVGRAARVQKNLERFAALYQENESTVNVLGIEGRPFWMIPFDGWKELQSWQGHEKLFERTVNWLKAAGSNP